MERADPADKDNIVMNPVLVFVEMKMRVFGFV
jgi:hypothetical protein